MVDPTLSPLKNFIEADNENSLNTSGTELTPQIIANFIQQHRDELSRFIARKLGSEDLSSDILQDAYLRLSNRLPAETIDNPRAFVYRIVANLVIDYQRLSVNRLSLDVDDEVIQNIPDMLPGPDKHYLHQQRLAAINKAMHELPELCRKVFYLHRVEGYSYTQVAASLNISESAVGKHLAQAIKHCRDRLRQH
ncbi:sigma-70 family RNA polymerase sigma factor [Methylomonas sp. AM2-LC]|uniref:RNA polymerase sigma factor n=1 Tax=Methylomonas sp. AM2-LC TaxID=3153301 RepID=UPI003264ACE0